MKLCDHSVRRTEVALLASDEQADLLVHGLADDLVQVFRPALSSLGGIVIEIAEALCQVRGGSENHPLVHVVRLRHRPGRNPPAQGAAAFRDDA